VGPTGDLPNETTEAGFVKKIDGGFEIFGTQFQFTADGRVEKK
jgi:hypothetical protein